jgi:hypothetical protein
MIILGHSALAAPACLTTGFTNLSLAEVETKLMSGSPEEGHHRDTFASLNQNQAKLTT